LIGLDDDDSDDDEDSNDDDDDDYDDSNDDINDDDNDKGDNDDSDDDNDDDDNDDDSDDDDNDDDNDDQKILYLWRIDLITLFPSDKVRIIECISFNSSRLEVTTSNRMLSPGVSLMWAYSE